MRSPTRPWTRTIAGGAASILLCLASPAWAEEPPSAAELLGAYNSRDIGIPGVRQIRLELIDGGVRTRDFRIVHAWQAEGDELRSLVALEKPDGLRGTSYLLYEASRAGIGVEVFLVLAAGKRQVLRIRPGRFDEGLLGSDFGYRDLLWRIPVDGYRLGEVVATDLDGTLVWAFDMEPVAENVRESTHWARNRHYFARETGFLVGTDYFAASESVEPDKRLRVVDWRMEDGVWTPLRMEMSLSEERSSILTLASIHLRLPPFPGDSFLPANLPSIVEALEGGDLPAFLKPHVD